MGPTGPGMPAASSFHLMLARLATEHEKEVQALRAESSRLAEALGALAQPGGGGELLLHGLRDENSKLLHEVLTLRARGAAKQESSLEVQKLQASLLATEQEREQLRLELAACRREQLRLEQERMQPAPPEGPPLLLPGYVEGEPQESEPAAASRCPQTVHLRPVSHDKCEVPPDESPTLRQVASVTSVQIPSGSRGDERSEESSSDDAEYLDTKIEKIAREEKVKQLERLVEMFQLEHQDLEDEVFMLSFDQLERVLRDKGAVMKSDRLQLVLAEICRAATVRRESDDEAEEAESGDKGHIEEIDLEVLVDLIVDGKIMSRVEASFAADVREVRNILIAQDVDEVIGKVTRLRRGTADRVRAAAQDSSVDRLLLRMNIVVSGAVLISIASLGASMDIAQDSAWWVVLEAVIGGVFVGEIVVKCQIFGAGHFFCGPHRVGNLFDFAITLVAILDVIISTITKIMEYGDAAQQVSAARISLVLRCVRLARIARLVKLFKAPCMKELANMLSGFFIGMPSLLWVMVLLGFVIYIMAIALKSTVGPEPDQDLVSQCGFGDNPNLSPLDNADCQACKLYAEEFLYSVPASMIVVFRCVVGDCTSKAGQSLSAHLSGCYTWKFDVIYFLGMVAVIFGLFNIITAIFVQATMDGLQFNHVQNKYAQLYESHYMRRKLEALVDRVKSIYKHEILSSSRAIGTAKLDKRLTSSGKHNDIMLSEPLFYKVMQDAVVNSLFEELDVKLDHRINTFQLFDLSNDGRVSLVELIQVLMKMRGEPHKSDLVASWALLEEFRNQFQEFQKTSLKNQKELYENQREIVKTMQSRRRDRGSLSSVGPSPC